MVINYNKPLGEPLRDLLRHDAKAIGERLLAAAVVLGYVVGKGEGLRPLYTFSVAYHWRNHLDTSS